MYKTIALIERRPLPGQRAHKCLGGIKIASGDNYISTMASDNVWIALHTTKSPHCGHVKNIAHRENSYKCKRGAKSIEEKTFSQDPSGGKRIKEKSLCHIFVKDLKIRLVRPTKIYSALI